MTPSGMGPAQLDDAGFDLACGLVRAANGVGAPVGERGKIFGRITHKLSVKSPSVGAVADLRCL